MPNDILDVLKEKIKMAKAKELTELDKKFLQEINKILAKYNILGEKKVSLAHDWNRIYLDGAIKAVAEKLGLKINLLIPDDNDMCIDYSIKK